ncbi:TP53-binding protein 1 [Araneus ventricosus]|uniref:TP53-binding protein 1 n=1 Tax=Araneus ventricosus TaxID=182803 RepID=A0A4Y2DR09_ARAVE|nr:TP53-binding protein 1 [Araneus ventricosus]
MDTSGDKKDDDEDESENEIEPSQSCLNDDTYSAFRDQLTQIAQESQTAHSTPDCAFNGGQTTLKFDSKALPVPSPIGKKPEANQSIISEPILSEHEQTTDILSSDSKLLSCESPVKGESKEESVPILVLDTEPEQFPEISGDAPEITIDDDKAMKETTVVCDTIELMSSVDDTAGEDPKEKVSSALEKPTEETAEKVTEHEKESESSNEKDLVAIELIAEDKEDTKVSVSDVPSTEEQGASGISSGENGVEEKKIADIPDSLPDTIPTAMLPPLTTSRLSRKQKFETTKKNPPGAPYEKSEKSAKCSIGAFKDTKSLEKIFNNSYGIFLDHECMESMLSLKPSEELKVRKVLDFTVRNNRVYLQQSIEIGSPSYLQHHQAISPHSGSSSNTTSSTVSTIKSLHSGEMADISSSSSAKSANSSSVIQFDITAHSSISSQEHGQITSTQKSEQPPNSFGNMFIQKKKDSFEMEEEISPIKKLEEPKTASGRKRGGRKAAPANNKAPPPKQRRGRAAKGGGEAGPSTASSESSSTNKDPEQFVQGRTKKSLRRKKNEKEEPPPKAIAEKQSSVEEIVVSDGNDPYKDSPYGSILPGVRVMARWKDGYYYPGIVQSQELEGRWSVRFDDNDIRAIPQENLIKVYNLELRTGVLVMSPDGFYDPGMICGYYKDSTGSGYEVEMDSGITKRYPRSAVILSNDQAKLLTSSRPPTTPATMTINLDNIIDGKRKRKSIQSPDSSSALKKTRTSQRISKVDPNLDSTESETTEKESTSTSLKRPAESTETEEEAITEQRSTRKRKAAKMGAVKITQSLAQSSGKHPKLFKDYAFLLTNAERKPAVSSDSEIFEGEEIMPFNKDELVDYILSRGGTILDKYEDIQKCTKKTVFLLANTYLRTMKYIKCLAAGIYCIKHHWVQNCCFKGEILNHSGYILPAGRSLITNQIVEWHGKSDVLKGLKICLVSAPENPFVYTWAPVLLAAKADFVQKWNLPSSKSGGNLHVDVLVTNIHCPPEILQSAKRRKIPIVSSEWVIQSLIAGKCLSYDAHPKFRHDFTE